MNAPDLEWSPELTCDRDLLRLDLVLINAHEETHARFLAFSGGDRPAHRGSLTLDTPPGESIAPKVLR